MIATIFNTAVVALWSYGQIQSETLTIPSAILEWLVLSIVFHFFYHHVAGMTLSVFDRLHQNAFQDFGYRFVIGGVATCIFNIMVHPFINNLFHDLLPSMFTHHQIG